MSNTRTIWKFVLPSQTGDQSVEMPSGARIIEVASQHDGPAIWAIVDPYAPTEVRRFTVLGTGWNFDPREATYLGTCHVPPFVWHVFEVDAER